MFEQRPGRDCATHDHDSGGSGDAGIVAGSGEQHQQHGGARDHERWLLPSVDPKQCLPIDSRMENEPAAERENVHAHVVEGANMIDRRGAHGALEAVAHPFGIDSGTRCDRTVRQHGPFWFPGGPRGVDDHGNVVRSDRGARGVEGAVADRPAGRQEAVEADRPASRFAEYDESLDSRPDTL